jgi:murein DD-endopeptidase MepM/ murein hydrolase activator NlpD
MSRLILTIVAIAALTTLPAVANAECKDDSICVDEIRVGQDVELHARNLRNFPITYTLRVMARNYSVKGPNTITRTLDAGETQRVMTLGRRDGRDKGVIRYSFKWTVGRIDAKHNDQYLYALPYAADSSYRVLQGYGSRFSHTGREEFAVDFDMKIGTPVHAARSGIVARVEESNSEGCWEDNCGQYANYIVILHDDGTTGEYYHLDKQGAEIDVGDTIFRGQRIGLSGNTGHTTMPHLHFAVYRAVDWGRTQSIAVRFEGADGIIDDPRRGARYQARLSSQTARK